MVLHLLRFTNGTQENTEQLRHRQRKYSDPAEKESYFQDSQPWFHWNCDDFKTTAQFLDKYIFQILCLKGLLDAEDDDRAIVMI